MSAVLPALQSDGQIWFRHKIYIGCTDGPFKTRYANHKQSFKNYKHSSATTLSNYIWTLKKCQKDYKVSWEILSKAVPYFCGTRKCDLCLTEKVLIATADPSPLLNSRAELISKCRHRNKYLLMNFKTWPPEIPVDELQNMTAGFTNLSSSPIPPSIYPWVEHDLYKLIVTLFYRYIVLFFRRNIFTWGLG